MSIHNEAKINEIAKTVIMPGDPLRAKYIAENFLTNYKLVNSVRGIYAYTGNYKNKTITVMASGMGMPSMGIYCYELYKFYNVENIIRIGSCGAYTEDLNLLDVILVNKSYTEGNFEKNMTGTECHIIESSNKINSIIENVSKKENITCKIANIACTECFDPYLNDQNQFISRLPKSENILASEMESFSLFYTAKQLQKHAACLLTVVDSICKKESLTSEQRQTSLNNMIKLALESAINL